MGLAPRPSVSGFFVKTPIDGFSVRMHQREGERRISPRAKITWSFMSTPEAGQNCEGVIWTGSMAAVNPTANLPSHPARCDGPLWRLRSSERKPETLSEGALAPGFSRPARRGSSRLCRCSSAAMETAMAPSCGRSWLRSKVLWPREHPGKATAQARGHQRRRDDVSDDPIPTIPDQYFLAEPSSEA